MLLLTGPLGSGKTHWILGQVRDCLRRGEDDWRLLTPTATMAEHLRNELAREGFVFRPSRIFTLFQLIEAWTNELEPVSPATLRLLVGRVLTRCCPAEFQRIHPFPGFQDCIAGLIDELSSAGCDAGRLEETLGQSLFGSDCAGALARIYREVERELVRRSLTLRSAGLAQAAGAIRERGVPGVRRLFLDGFYGFTDLELAVVTAMRQHADLTVTLPLWEGAEPARRALVAAGLPERRLSERVRACPVPVLVAAPTLEQEIEEIARRIVEESGEGRPFREMGVLVRSQEPYVPALRTVFARFGIPARFYFAEVLANHPVTRYFSAVVEAFLSGWDHARTLRAMRMVLSGLGEEAGDRFEFEALERLPGLGLAGLRELAQAAPEAETFLGALASLESAWSGAQTASGWARSLRLLRKLCRPPEIADGAGWEQASIWRAQAAALDAFDAALEETAAALAREEAIALADFWREAETVLRLTPLRVMDRRANVVHVMDAYESRQWELPVVFVCGLLEKQFPRRHGENPILADEPRRLLQCRGLRVRTSDERQREEDFLFELATSRAASRTILSYPRFNASGDENLPSFPLSALREAGGVVEEDPMAARPKPRRIPPPRSESRIGAEDLREALRARHRRLSPSRIENFLQCPFLFFARQTLKLQAPPPRPEERLDALVQGQIVHQVLAALAATPQPLGSLFESIFAERCARHRVPAGYRREAVRLELLRNLEGLQADTRLARGETQVEIAFELPLEDVLLAGRLDRLDIQPDGRALVIDYKYSRGDRIRKNLRAEREGNIVQGGLYLLAVRDRYRRRPAGVLYCAFRKEVVWDGWHSGMAALQGVGEQVSEQELVERMEFARARSIAVLVEIREGRIEPAPADRDKCRYCDFRDVCRVDLPAEAILEAGGAA